MSFLFGNGYYVSEDRNKSRSDSHKSHSHSHSRARSSSPKKTYVVRTSSPTRSTHSNATETKKYFVRERTHSPERSTSSRGFFSRPHSSSNSYYKRSPRQGYISRLIHKIRSLLRDLIDYAKRHPAKLFFVFILPLITGGALAKLLASFGVRLPSNLSGLMGGSGAAKYMESASTGGLGVSDVMNIAKMFV